MHMGPEVEIAPQKKSQYRFFKAITVISFKFLKQQKKISSLARRGEILLQFEVMPNSVSRRVAERCDYGKARNC